MAHNPATFVGLVLDNGPDNAHQVLVLAAIAERCNADGMAWPSYDDIAHRARIHRRNAIRHVKALVDDGWLGVRKGGGRGHANLYVLNLGRLKGDAGVTISEPIKGGAGVTDNEERVALASIKGGAGVTRTPKNPQVVVAAPEPMAGVLVGVSSDDDDEQYEPNDIETVLRGIKGRTQITRPWRKMARAALARGWEPEALNAFLHSRMAMVNGGAVSVGLARRILEEDEPPSAAQRRQEPREPCTTCHDSGWVEDDNGNPIGRCPDCHPKAATG